MPTRFMFSISNTRVPIQSVEADVDGSGNFQQLRRGDPDNHFNVNGNYKFPMQVGLPAGHRSC
jgi:hypothetical protein